MDGFIGHHLQGDCLKPERFCFGISPKLIELHPRFIALKQQKFIGFYFVPGLSKSEFVNRYSISMRPGGNES